MDTYRKIDAIIAKAAKDIFATAPNHAGDTLTAMRNAGAEHLVKELTDALMEMITEMSSDFITACVDEAGMSGFVDVEVYRLTPDYEVRDEVSH